MVDAVVHAPFGAHPGTVPGLYGCDTEHLDLFFQAQSKEDMAKYLDTYVYSVENHEAYLDLIGRDRLEELRESETIREGYYDE
jgi:glutaconate CoA-transferase subunit A